MKEKFKIQLVRAFLLAVVVFIIHQIISCVNEQIHLNKETEMAIRFSDSLDKEPVSDDFKKIDSILTETVKEQRKESHSANKAIDNDVYPKYVTATIHGKPYRLGIGMSEGEITLKCGNPDDIARSSTNVSTVIYYYDHSNVQLFIYNGELQQVVELKKK
jgi:hypothetical protein